jgi:transcriptional repressor NrdR
MNRLVDVDEIAYIRFASVYRQFKDTGVFFNELKDMLAKDKQKEKKHESDQGQSEAK